MTSSPNRQIEAARLYHAATNHSYWSVRTGGRELDWPNYPRPFKIYPRLDPIPLPRDFPPTNVPALAATIAVSPSEPKHLEHPDPVILSEAKDRKHEDPVAASESKPHQPRKSVIENESKEPSHQDPVILSEAKDPKATSTPEPSTPTLAQLASLLYHSAGVTRRRSWPGGEIYFRAAACTGALYEIELYLVTGDLESLPAGVYHFNPADFALRRLREGDWRSVLVAAAASEPSLAHAPVAVIASGIYWRNAWKYGPRTYRHFGWDNGTLHANLVAMAAAHRLPAHLVLGFEDSPVNRLLALDTGKEVALSILALGRAEGQIPPAPREIPALSLETVPYSPEEVDFPEIRAMHASTILTTPAEVAAWRAAAPEMSPISRPAAEPKELSIPLPTAPRPSAEHEEAGRTDSLESVILRRGSSRRFTHDPITLAELAAALEFATRPLPADFLAPSGRLNDLYLIANAVEGLDSGAYFLARDPLRLELLKSGSFRDQAGYLGLEQALAADAAAAIFFLADLDSVLARFGNRGYRAAQLEAGILGGRLYLAAYAQRLGATGLTFYDDEVVAFFSPHAAAKAAIFLVALGHRAKRLRTL